MRYAGQKRRATTNKKFELSEDISKVISFAKKYHRSDGEFYIVKENLYGNYTNVSKTEYELYKYDEYEKHFVFENKRWREK